MMEVASRRNAIPLPPIEDKPGLRLPPDSHALLGAKYRITSQRQPSTVRAPPLVIAIPPAAPQPPSHTPMDT